MLVKRLLNQTLVFGLAALVVFVDQYTKYLVRAHVGVGQTWLPEAWQGLMPYARILHTENTGAAFGMFQAGGQIFAVTAVIVSALIIYYAARLEPGLWWMRVTLGLQLGGALGNLVDRLVRGPVLAGGPVTDFISVGSFAIFNVADASISMGVACLVILMLFEAREARKTAPAAPPETIEANGTPSA